MNSFGPRRRVGIDFDAPIEQSLSQQKGAAAALKEAGYATLRDVTSRAKLTDIREAIKTYFGRNPAGENGTIGVTNSATVAVVRVVLENGGKFEAESPPSIWHSPSGRDVTINEILQRLENMWHSKANANRFLLALAKDDLLFGGEIPPDYDSLQVLLPDEMSTASKNKIARTSTPSQRPAIVVPASSSPAQHRDYWSERSNGGDDRAAQMAKVNQQIVDQQTEWARQSDERIAQAVFGDPEKRSAYESLLGFVPRRSTPASLSRLWTHSVAQIERTLGAAELSVDDLKSGADDRPLLHHQVETLSAVEQIAASTKEHNARVASRGNSIAF